MATQLDNDIVAWQNAEKALEKAKVLEMELRKKVYAAAFPNAEVGTNTLELGEGYKLKAVRKINYNLKETVAGAETSVALDAMAKLGNEGSFIADRLVKWKPDLSLTEYKKIDTGTETGKKIKALIDSVLTTSDGAPTLEVVNPKA